MIDFKDKTSEAKGTPINRANMMAIQGMANETVTIEEDINGNVIITAANENNQILTVEVVEHDDGTFTITETFVGQKTITKTTTINADGTQISGVIQ